QSTRRQGSNHPRANEHGQPCDWPRQWLISLSLGNYVCSSCVPVPNTVRATSPRLSVGGLPTTSAVSRPHTKSSPVFTPMQRRFSPVWRTAKLRALPSLFQTVLRPSASQASGAGSGTASSAEASDCGGSQALRHYHPIVWGT